MKKALIIIVILIVVGAAGFGGLLYLKGKNSTTDTGEPTQGGSGITLRDFFPFGSNTKVDENETPLTPDITPAETDTNTTPSKEQKLIQISGNPVAGFGFAQVDVMPGQVQEDKEVVTAQTTFVFKKDLAIKTKNTDVKELQKLFNQCGELQIAPSGVGSPGKESTTFDLATENAVKIFQRIFFIFDEATQEPTGKVDAATREKLNTPFQCTKPVPPPQITKKEVVRYAEKATGRIYETLLDSPSVEKVTTTTIPRVHEAIFVPGSETVVMRYLNQDTKAIQTFAGTVPTHTIGVENTNTELKGTFLPENILSFVKGDAGRTFYLTRFDGGVNGDVFMPTQNKTTSVFKSPFSEWKPQFVNTNTVLLTTKASSAVPGYAYMLDIDKKTTSKILGPINGLTTLMSPDKNHVLYSATVGGIVTFNDYNRTKQTRTTFPFITLPAKCVFATNTIAYCGVPTVMANGGYPDVWYQGIVSFSDVIWKIDFETGTNTLIETPTESVGQDIDATSLALDSTGTKLFFINKKDSSLWSLKLN